MWYAIVIYKEQILEPPTMAIFILPTTTPSPRLPLTGAKMLGTVQLSRLRAIEEAISYLQVERVVAESDLLEHKRKVLGGS